MSRPRPLLRRLALAALLCLGVSPLVAGCAVRTVPPVRWVPLIGAEKRTTTTDVLVRALHDRDLTLRAQSVALLGVLAQSDDDGLRREVAAILGMALRDRDPGLRLQAVEQLGKMGGKFANKYLYSALRDPNPFVRSKVLEVVAAREEQARAAREQAEQAKQAAQAAAAAAAAP